MEFFNKKEEVLEIKLTQFGKRLYADGKFKPKFYAFYDNDIIYDTEYASTSEPNHSASIRIKDAPRMKIQSALYGIETDINRKIEGIKRTNGNVTPQNIQQIKEKSYVLTNALGKSDTAKDYAPAWDLKSYFARIDTSSRTITDAGKLNHITIPQINLQDLNYRIRALGKPDFNASVLGHTFEDGTCLTIDEKEGELLLGLREVNSPLSNDKFEIEVFMVNEENNQENLIPLTFNKSPDKIVNDVLLEDQVIDKEEVDETSVERYMNVETDLEIDEEFLRRALGSSAFMTDMEEIRTFGLSGQFLSDEELPADGLVGSQKAAMLNPDDIAKLSGKELGELRGNKTDELQTSKENIYNKVPLNTTNDHCGEDE